VGFQLSYLAVIGIVTFQPHILCIWKPKAKIANYFWQLMSVSVAAQLATFPLSVYYFGQFPNYFLIANLAVIMLSSVVLITGILTLALSFSALLSGWSAWLLTKEIYVMNTIIRFVEELPGAVTDRISINTIQLFALCFVIIILLWTMVSRNKKGILALLSGLALFGGLHVIDVWRKQRQETITCYAMQSGSALSFNFHGKALLLCDSSLTPKSQNYKFNIQNHECKERIISHFFGFETDTIIEEKQFCKQGNFIRFGNKTLLLAQNNMHYYPVDKPITIDYLLVRQNTKCHLEYMVEALKIKQVIVDESNNSYTTQQWQEACRILQIDCWNVRERGAWSMEQENRDKRD
jgi:competence protein ComEC